ncbi:hypothetical protein THTE_3346 [Thermogutta terrifontis]|uniref:Uncharacterized protein n=1 Tax=Thermogutta terrifontis TaxID=1331910 RepID=A0A286RJ14_9BACT|nr:hypothetical protein THTE_3346 [Thermogutta terrifontis]
MRNAFGNGSPSAEALEGMLLRPVVRALREWLFRRIRGSPGPDTRSANAKEASEQSAAVVT